MNLYGEEVTEHMTLRDMEYIAAIAEDKSITRASTRLFVAQPALSQCVQKVEKELGVRIFLRESSGVRLTAEGQCYMEFIQKTLHEQKNLHKKLEDLRRADLGQIHLGFTGTQRCRTLASGKPDQRDQSPPYHYRSGRHGGRTRQCPCGTHFPTHNRCSDFRWVRRM